MKFRVRYRKTGGRWLLSRIIVAEHWTHALAEWMVDARVLEDGVEVETLVLIDKGE